MKSIFDDEQELQVAGGGKKETAKAKKQKPLNLMLHFMSKNCAKEMHKKE